MMTNLMTALLLTLPIFAQAQDPSNVSGIENARTVTVEINGDCGMCERTIEKAGSKEGLSALDWDVDSHIATITYDSTWTDLDAILLRVANAGYDNERSRAPDDVYDALPGCCQYERSLEPEEERNGAK